jgi:hypothetical protein
MGEISLVPRKVRVGLIGCGEVAQVVHIPTLNYLSELFQITYLCDISQAALAHCRTKVVGEPPKTTTNPEELCMSPLVDVVFVLNSDEYHAAHGILALKHNKHVLIEKPMALNERDADAIIQAERESQGRAMIGYMRRYAPAFEDAIREIGGMDQILYARVRGMLTADMVTTLNRALTLQSPSDIIGPNATFVEQSGTFPKRATDFSPADVEDKNSRAADIVSQGMEKEAGVSSSKIPARMWRALGGLGSHDLSLMREALGMPEGVVGAHLNVPFWRLV